MSKIAKALAIAVVASITAVGTPGTADAKVIRVIKVGHVVKHNHYFGFRHFAYVAPIYGAGCGYFYQKWQATGSFFWKNKYFACKGY